MDNKETTKLVDKIGTPALLELMAEEATELSFACLKLARYLRDENPMASDHDQAELSMRIDEEVADCYVTLRELRKAPNIVNNNAVSEFIDFKRKRMNERLGMKAESFIF